MKTVLQMKASATVSSRYILYTKILQMPAPQLRELIAEELSENPLLEFPEERLGTVEPIIYDTKDYPDSCGNYQEDYENGFKEDWDAYYGSVGLSGRKESLPEYLAAQLRTEDIILKRAAVCIIYSLDKNGWFKNSLEELGSVFGIEECVMEKALRMVQGLEPAGVGARDLAECLEIQILRSEEKDPELLGLCVRIIREHLEALSQKKYSKIAKETCAGTAKVKKACLLIRQLNPHPVSSLVNVEPARYVIPDLLLEIEDGEMVLSLLKGVIPDVYINMEYVSYLKQRGGKDEEISSYVSEYLERARRLCGFIKQRNVTLLKIAGYIVQWQDDFFNNRKETIIPMTLADIAAMASMHESTVNRTVHDKYIMTPKGVFELNSFFTRAVSVREDGEAVSAEQIKARMGEIIKEYQGERKLSDQKISDMLRAEGIQVARRTVAKYRHDMNIHIDSVNGR